MNKKILTTT